MTKFMESKYLKTRKVALPYLSTGTGDAVECGKYRKVMILEHGIKEYVLEKRMLSLSVKSICYIYGMRDMVAISLVKVGQLQRQCLFENVTREVQSKE